MRKLLLLVAALLIASVASAQPLTIHGAPQGVTTYATPAAWPPLSGQCHWKAPGPDVNPDGPLVPGIAHTHIEGHFPIWAQLPAGPVTVPISVVLFHTKGAIYGVGGQIMGPRGPVDMTEVVIDQPLPIRGDPNGVVSFTGHATFDPALSFTRGESSDGPLERTIPLHGWFNTRVMARTIYDDGEVVDTQLWIPYFSMLDPSQPEPGIGEGTMQLRAGCSVGGVTTEGFGEHVTEIRGTEAIARGYLPILAPINEPFVIYPLTYNYKALQMFPHYDLRLDLNLHMGVAGSVLASTQTEIPGQGVSNVDMLDPVVIAASTPQMGTTPGKHKIAALWEQESGPQGSPGLAGGFPPNERLVSLLVFEVAIGDHPTSAPPVVCTDPRATNVGGPLPCVFPPPPPPPPPPVDVWAPVTAVFQRFGTTTRYRLCPTSDASACVELVIK